MCCGVVGRQRDVGEGHVHVAPLLQCTGTPTDPAIITSTLRCYMGKEGKNTKSKPDFCDAARRSRGDTTGTRRRTERVESMVTSVAAAKPEAYQQMYKALKVN